MNERDIFLAAIEISDDAARAKYIALQCEGNPTLRASVEALLRSHVNPGSFMAEPLAQLTPPELLAPTNKVASADQHARHGVPDDTTRDFSPHTPDQRAVEFLQPSTVVGSIGRLDHYEVHEILGSGGFGIVLRAFDDKLHRMVAIKIMSAELAATSPARKRFLREARAAAAVRHEHVVQIHAVEEHPLPYLVMEFIPGQTLEQRLVSHGPLGNADVLRLGYQIASGLAAAHEKGLIHRDIKPANIMLESGVKECVKLTDFGLARACDDASLTQSGMIAGTPMYMSPEQAHGHALDQRSDLYSLGSVLYQMVSGRPPFRAASTVAVLQRVAESSPRPIPEIIPEAPEWLVATIARLHARNPADRIQTARELAELLRQFEKDLEQGRIPQVPWRQPSPPVSSQPAAVVQSAPPSRVSMPRYRSALVGAAAVMFMLVGIGLTEATGVTRISSSLIRLAFGEGILVIESNDPDLRIKVDDSEMTISGGGISELKLRPGTHTITATRNGATVKQELVQIFRDGRQVLKVGLESGTAAQPAVQTASSPDVKTATPVAKAAPAPVKFHEDLVDYKAERAAAEWVLSVGGEVYCTRFQLDGTEVAAPLVDGKLPDGEFLITDVIFDQTRMAQHRLTDDDLERFQKCVGIVHFHIRNAPRITARGINFLPSSNRLYEFGVQGTSIDPAGIDWRRWPELARLFVLFEPPTEWLKVLNEIPSVNWLQIGSNDVKLQAAGVKALRVHERMRHLELAELAGSALSLEEYRELMTKLPNLELLCTSSDSKSDSKILSTCIGELKHLQRISCKAPCIDESVVTNLLDCPKFRELLIWMEQGQGLTLEQFRQIGRLGKQLRSLEFGPRESSQSWFTPEVDQELAKLTELENFHMGVMDPAKFDIGRIPSVIKLWPKLKTVSLHGADFTRIAAELTTAHPGVRFFIEGKEYPATQGKN